MSRLTFMNAHTPLEYSMAAKVRVELSPITRTVYPPGLSVSPGAIA